MDIFSLILLALGLSMDAFATSLTDGMCEHKITIGKTLFIALTFGVFQAVMPLIGYFLGSTFSEAVSAFDHYIALILLAAIGVSMIVESFSKEKDQCPTSVKMILIQGVATSIDALASGVGLALVNVNIFLACLFIGVITFALCVLGVRIGRSAGKLLRNKAQFAGGVILIGIGLKIFLEHTFF